MRKRKSHARITGCQYDVIALPRLDGPKSMSWLDDILPVPTWNDPPIRQVRQPPRLIDRQLVDPRFVNRLDLVVMLVRASQSDCPLRMLRRQKVDFKAIHFGGLLGNPPPRDFDRYAIPEILSMAEREATGQERSNSISRRLRRCLYHLHFAKIQIGLCTGYGKQRLKTGMTTDESLVNVPSAPIGSGHRWQINAKNGSPERHCTPKWSASHRCDIHDLHAIKLQLLGIDSIRLACHLNGRDFHLTDV
ncbi:MAG: hypothetical protein IT427_05480 [Pirellulales bacterium]|nr:hypothetical protein [Pirellulales bacterium]